MEMMSPDNAMKGGRTMSKYGYTGSKQFYPLTPWAYVGYSVLFSLPIVGWVCLIIFTFNSSNINVRSFARSYWCYLLLSLIIFAVAMAVLRSARPSLSSDFSSQNGGVMMDRVKTFIIEILDLDDFIKEREGKAISKTASTVAESGGGFSWDGAASEHKEAVGSCGAFFETGMGFMRDTEKRLMT